MGRIAPTQRLCTARTAFKKYLPAGLQAYRSEPGSWANTLSSTSESNWYFDYAADRFVDLPRTTARRWSDFTVVAPAVMPTRVS